MAIAGRGDEPGWPASVCGRASAAAAGCGELAGGAAHTAELERPKFWRGLAAMTPDEPGNEDEEPGGFIAIIGHIRRRPVRDRHGSSAHGEVAGGRYDRASRSMNPSLHPNVY